MVPLRRCLVEPYLQYLFKAQSFGEPEQLGRVGFGEHILQDWLGGTTCTETSKVSAGSKRIFSCLFHSKGLSLGPKSVEVAQTLHERLARFKQRLAEYSRWSHMYSLWFKPKHVCM